MRPGNAREGDCRLRRRHADCQRRPTTGDGSASEGIGVTLDRRLGHLAPINHDPVDPPDNCLPTGWIGAEEARASRHAEAVTDACGRACRHPVDVNPHRESSRVPDVGDMPGNRG